ncbi:MAG: CoA pyrophosphatase [Planctomycetota bacterium]|nr:CoA pyrophosphatase [Planctomycetota bacterium]MDA0933001.1 CoA pyrophosphatase [Planctomycetota bacterium]
MSREGRGGRADDDLLRDVLDPPIQCWEGREGLRDAAVLAPWLTRGDEDWLVFTRRRDDLRHHPGQVSFPGGRRDGDESPIECALREAREEIGLHPDEVRVLGALPARLSVAGFWVQVVVARVDAPLEALTPDPAEVAEVLAFPVERLRDPGAWVIRAPDGHPGRRPSPHFEHDGHVLWGLTARFTLDLLERVFPELRGQR